MAITSAADRSPIKGIGRLIVPPSGPSAQLRRRPASSAPTRTSYLRSIFAEIGFRGRELEMRTRLFVVFHSMDHALHSDLTEAEEKSHLRLRRAPLTRR